MKKRTYGTGSYVPRGDGKWRLFYRPEWSDKPLSRTVEATNEKAAGRTLSDWVTELDRQSAPTVEVSVRDLIKLNVARMRVEGRDALNIQHIERRSTKHLARHFAGRDFAVPLKKADVNRYKDSRLKEGAARATINRELSVLRRGLTLAVDEELITVPIPRIEKLPENNVRTGFVNEEQYQAILQNLPDHQKMLWCFAYRLGIRKGELLKIRIEWLLPYWQQEEPFIKIPGFDGSGNRITKSGKPHTIPIHHPELRAFVEMALQQRNAECPWLFQYRGKRLKNIRTAFENARKQAGLPDLIFHDTRRSAVRRMEKAGIDRARAMQITGHRTESVYKRYDIAEENAAQDTGRKLREYELQQTQFSPEFSPDRSTGQPAHHKSEQDKYLN